jgi:DNA-binding transcriptional regulator YiaG
MNAHEAKLDVEQYCCQAVKALKSQIPLASALNVQAEMRAVFDAICEYRNAAERVEVPEQDILASLIAAHTEEPKTGFGERLKAARKMEGLSQEELGRRAGEGGKDASKASVSDWEHERHYPKADQLRTMCMRLGVCADELLFGGQK